MKFLCLCYYDQQKFDSWSKEDMEAVPKACAPHDAALRKTGKMTMVGSLAFPKDAKTIRPSDSGPQVKDGPYARTTEPLGAFFFVEAKDIDEAASVASKHPGAHLGKYFGGGIEVRPCDTVEQL
jgi:hypothetical protein